MEAPIRTRETRHSELKKIAVSPNGISKIYLILTTSNIAFEKLPIGSLMIEAILDHEYPDQK